MAATRFAALAVLAGLLAPAAAHAVSLDEQIKAAYAAWDAAFNKQDPKALGAFYTSDATFLPDTHEVLTGPDGVAKYFSGAFAAGFTGHHLELIKAEGDDHFAIVAGKWSAHGKDEKGAPATFGGLSTVIFEKQADGSLKIKLHTFN